VIEYYETASESNLNENNVLRCTRFNVAHNPGDSSMIQCDSALGGAVDDLIEDSYVFLTDINRAYDSSISVLGDNGCSYRRVWAMMGCDGSKIDGGLMRDVWIDERAAWTGGRSDNKSYCNDSDPHHDGTQITGSNVGALWWVDSRIEGLWKYETSAILWGGGPFGDVTVQNTWLQGGNYTVYPEANWNGNFRFINNRVVDNSWNFGFWNGENPSSPCKEWGGNYYMDGADTATQNEGMDHFTLGSAIPAPTGGWSAPGSCSGGLTPIPTMTVATLTLPERSSCDSGDSLCNDINIQALATGVTPYAASPNERWRYSCGGSPTNISANPCPGGCLGGYQDGGADLWYDYPACNGQASCTFTDVCDFSGEGAGTYTVKVYVESGPGTHVRASGHDEITFTVNP
jgi:hypothetical protein